MKCVFALVLLMVLAPVLAPALANAGYEGGGHWQSPVQVLGDGLTPDDVSPLACAACHPQQAADWRGSLHAGAASDGVLGQLAAFAPDAVRSCLSCHLPRADLQARLRQDGPMAWPHLSGVDCASCHLRDGTWHGPRDHPAGSSHGVKANPLFASADLCRSCHQQAAGETDPPLMNTWAEWRDSPQAARGETCQSCHMPEGRHLFRGIHDPAMARRAMTVEAVRDADGVRAVLTNSGAGHFLPTYPTPRVVLRIAAQGGGVVEMVIQRRLETAADGRLVTVADTRLPPGASAKARLAVAADRPVIVTVEVYPNADYHERAFPALIAALEPELDPDSLDALRRALQAAGRTAFVAVRLDCPAGEGACHPRPGEAP